jgi:hypothetical protein
MRVYVPLLEINPRAAGALSIGILSPKTAGLKHNRVSVDVVPEPKAAQSQAILPFSAFDIHQFLDRVMATAVIWVSGENSA